MDLWTETGHILGVHYRFVLNWVIMLLYTLLLMMVINVMGMIFKGQKYSVDFWSDDK